MGAIALHDTRPRLSELAETPTLVVHGLEDGLVPPARGRELAELIPGAQLELIPECGHLLTTDAEEQTAGAILAHLDRCATTAQRTRWRKRLGWHSAAGRERRSSSAR